MLLLRESQIQNMLDQRRTAMIVGLLLMALPFALPKGWGIGFFSGFMLLSFSIYGFGFQRWRTEPGVWMLAILLTVTLGTCCLYFEYLHWQKFFAPPAPNKIGRIITWHEMRLSIDAAIALLILSRTVKFALSVAVENWNRTRIV